MERLVARAEPDLVNPADQLQLPPAPRSSLRRRRGVTAAVVALAFGAGAGAGVAVADDENELKAVRGQLERSQVVVKRLATTVADVRKANKTLAVSLEETEALADAAGHKAAVKSRRLDGRAAALDEREADLDSREAAVDDQESALDSTDSVSSAPSVDGSASDFDRAWAVDIASDIVQDVKTVDHRLGDGIAVESALSLLSGNFPRLLDAGIPSGVDEAQYVARLETLESFTDEAADLYSSDPTEGSARYAVVREQIEVLLEQLNAAIGSDFRLP